MGWNLGRLFPGKSGPITKQVSVETGGLRDQYLQHIMDTSQNGTAAMSWEDFVKSQQGK